MDNFKHEKLFKHEKVLKVKDPSDPSNSERKMKTYKDSDGKMVVALPKTFKFIKKGCKN